MSESSSPPASCAPNGLATAAEQSRWFADQVHPHDSQLKAYLRGSFPAVRDVDDVVQESYLHLWKARAAQPIRSAKALLYAVARNVALKVLRKSGNAPFVPLANFPADAVADERPDAAESVGLQEKIDLLADAVTSLPPRCREIIILHKIQGRSQKEVAKQLGLSARTVESQVRIGVRRCLRFLEKRGVSKFYGDET
jgi:RNA polymerase sigma-70 factor (ECF subfamily)